MLAERLRRLTDSLAGRIILFGLFLIVLSQTLRLAILSNSLQSGFQEVISAEQFSLASYVASDIDGKIRLRQQMLERLAKDLPVDLLREPKQVELWLSRHYALNPLFSLGLAVVPADGHGSIADFPPLPGRRGLDFTTTDWFREVSRTLKPAIGAPMLGRAAHQPVIVMAAPRLDANGRVVAIVAGVTALDTPGFLDLIQETHLGKSGGFLLVSPRDNLFVAASAAEMRLKPLPPLGANRLHDAAMAGFRGTGITVNAYGVENLASFASVPAADWFVVARLPTAEAFAPIEKMRSRYMANSIAIGLLIVAVLLLFLRHAFRPMKQAAEQMRRMADGKAPLAPLPVVRRDEVGEMTEGFNTLLEKLRESEARMAHLAHHDALTGLPNRLSFLAHMQKGAALARRHDARLALLFIDLDGFKPVNDRYGHEVGDQLLQQVAARLNEGVRESDTVARFGGDEFVLLLTDVVDSHDVAAIAEKIIARLSAPYAVDGVQLSIGASIGIALFPDDAEDAGALIAQADAAMYDAKRGGRGCCRFAHRRE